jgi:tRNA (adenine57-N1/adenine58-N1)-methyltransferase
MVGHTGFLVTTRRLADGVEAPARRRRPAKSAETGEPGVDEAWGKWSPDDLGERPVSEKKVRKVRREVTGGRPAAADPAEPDAPNGTVPGAGDVGSGTEGESPGVDSGGPASDHRT